MSRKRRPPVHPGEILRHEFLDDLGITPYRLARDIGVPPNRITGIINGTRAITAETALRLARYLNVSPELWMNLQTDYDLELARRERGAAIRKIRAVG
jgi:antitoxin HigA-1